MPKVHTKVIFSKYREDISQCCNNLEVHGARIGQMVQQRQFFIAGPQRWPLAGIS